MRTTMRTHACGELRSVDVGQEVALCGWVWRQRAAIRAAIGPRGNRGIVDTARIKAAADYLASVNLSKDETYKYKLQAFPRPKGRETHVIYTTYDLARPEAMPHDVVFHQGALPSVPRSVQDPLTTTAVNVEGTLGLFRLCRDLADPAVRFLFPSSIAVYGLPDTKTKSEQGALKEWQWTEPAGIYGCNKL